ncbi:CubicO group peptidase (beta-lactamase class C family) [Stella humosa]|uniref:CubicO group peptidase (Beta-lactamase class C family) n=1 Tax=Stella humosa TaxID=94 RepID=A0A3N1MD43_9PROT|nr:serine hydrolase domain-containing protein [Stella humosa]ROQ01209.1 CubicO group peptidase (beta-lactamase class C family) [Stella humosa]BBK31583.1 serine hydrolase [Stella humosa]
MKNTMLGVVAGLWLLAMPAAHAQGLAKVEKPEDVGLSGERLERISKRMRQGVEKGELPGAVVLVARHGHVAYLKAFGLRDPEAKAAMATDAIFRIASMTKPITSLAIMMLAEEGALSIADPAEKYLPEFKDLKVGTVRQVDGKSEVALEPQRRPMTVQDLLRHTSGLTYGAAGDNPLKQAYVDAKASDRGQTNAEMVTKLSKLALVFQPGTTWEYSMSTDVLGRIVEVASGMPLDRFVAERILKPLKMNDTGYSVPAEKAGRGARPHREGAKNEVPAVPLVTQDFAWKSGGGGMVSTASDYARFCQFWLNGGQLDGVRLVSRKTIELMSSDHLPPGTKMGPDMARFEALTPSREMGQGFGLGFAVRNEAGMSPLHGSPGDIFWGGAFGTYFWIDPAEGMFAILMMQSPHARLPYRYLMRELVYQAIVD